MCHLKFRKIFLLVILAIALAPVPSLAVPMDFAIDLSGNLGTVTVDNPGVAGQATTPLLAFDLDIIVPANPCCSPMGTPPLMLSITLADFDSAADIPDALFFDGQFAGLDVTNGSGTLGALQFDFQFQPVATNAGEINPAASGPGQITVQDTGTTFIYDGLFSVAFSPITNDVVPEPGTALLLGGGLVSLAGARRRKAAISRRCA